MKVDYNLYGYRVKVLRSLVTRRVRTINESKQKADDTVAETVS